MDGDGLMDKNPALTRVAHEATYTQCGTAGYLLAAPEQGYLVTCPHGCNLGTSAHAPDLEAAKSRVDLHRLATGPLKPYRA